MSDDLKGPPPPGGIQPIFNDPVEQLERERKQLRALAEKVTPPAARELVKSSAAAFNRMEPIPGSRRAPAPLRARQTMAQQQPLRPAPVVRDLTASAGLTPTKSAATTQTPNGNQSLQTQIANLQRQLNELTANQQTKPVSNLIQPVDAQGQPIADPRPPEKVEAPKLVFNPAPDGTFVKVADRPAPKNLPPGSVWTQKYLATHDNVPFGIARDKFCADLIAQAINVYFNAMLQQQAEAAAAKAAREAAQSDANAFDALPAGEGQEVDAITGEPINPNDELPSV